MSPVLLTFLSLVAYVCGLVMLVKVTPHLLKRNFDEGFFMGIAAADILGGLLIFAPVGLIFALFNGSVGVRIVDVILLLVTGIVALRTSIRSFRPTYPAGVFRVSSILAGSYCLLLVGAAFYIIVLMFAQP